MYVSLWRRQPIQVLPTIALTNGTLATTDMLVVTLPILHMDTKYTLSLGMDSLVSCFKDWIRWVLHSYSYSYLQYLSTLCHAYRRYYSAQIN